MRTLILATVLAGALAVSAAAQSVGTFTATATVDNTALAVSNVQDLRFGIVVPSTPTAINPRTSTNAGYFLIQGARNAQITVAMTLPASLRVGTTGPTMPITFDANSGCHRNQPNQAICTLYDPNNVLTVRVRNQNPPNNHYHVWLGGTVSPGAGQAAGVYTGTIATTVAYTGN